MSGPTTCSPLLITELLETILLYTPPATVVTACRAVCHRWRELVDASPLLKRHTWRADPNIPARRRRLKAVGHAFRRNPLLSDILAKFWKRLNAVYAPVDDGDTTAPPAKALDNNEVVRLFRPVCQSYQLADPAPASVLIRLAVQRQNGRMLARYYRSVSSDSTRQVVDLEVLILLMKEMLQLQQQKLYLPGERNSVVAELQYSVLLRRPGETRRREVAIEERISFQCSEPWGISVMETSSGRAYGASD
ncbi:hypothetical protein DRE_01575 [Drechslerella stenobrocha 248]|uniref:F-box domain-containing protein n=1 Tax=Drechslerella stenobrocha 248 TaxID=1043628 RepID=W7HV14_9PEZI|nr:hypothetical protein DRE_01575 [Drechslerella stenobrocha 248]